MPVLDAARRHEGGQDQGETAKGRLGAHEEPALGEAIGEGAGSDGEEQDGRELEGADEPELER